MTGNLRKFFSQRVRQQYQGKPGRLVREAVENFLAGDTAPHALSPDVVVQLTRALCGEIDAREMGFLLGDTDQPRMLRDIIQRELAALRPSAKKDNRAIADPLLIAQASAQKLKAQPIRPKKNFEDERANIREGQNTKGAP